MLSKRSCNIPEAEEEGSLQAVEEEDDSLVRQTAEMNRRLRRSLSRTLLI